MFVGFAVLGMVFLIPAVVFVDGLITGGSHPRPNPDKPGAHPVVIIMTVDADQAP